MGFYLDLARSAGGSVLEMGYGKGRILIPTAEVGAIFQNRDGGIVVQAFLTGILPAAEEKQILNEMLAEGDPTNKAG